MNDRYGRMERLRQTCHDIRQPAAEVPALVKPAVAREAAENHEKRDCGRSGLGEGRVNLCLPPATSRMGGRAAGATCSV
jgi:hypothetical protein